MRPFIPLLTEELRQQRPHQGMTIVKAQYPSVTQEWINGAPDQEMTLVMEIISAPGTIRSTFKIPNATKLRPHIKRSAEYTQLIARHRSYIVSLANISGSLGIPVIGHEVL
jgi:valyl-tRNA synthetase